MRNIYDVIREKEAAIAQLQKDVEALRVAARILTEEEKTETARPARPTVTPAAATDTEVVLRAPLRQFP